MIHPHEEAGYLYLQQTDIFLRCSSNEDIQTKSSKWLTVSIIDTENNYSSAPSLKKQRVSHNDDSNNDELKLDSPMSKNAHNHSLLLSPLPSIDSELSNFLKSSSNEGSFDENSDIEKSPILGRDPCSQDHVILTVNAANTNNLTLLSSEIPYFDGTINDLKSQKGMKDEKNRSDAALLLGTAYASSCTGHARIESMQIFIHPGSWRDHKQSLFRVITDMIITISLPFLEEQSVISYLGPASQSFENLHYYALGSERADVIHLMYPGAQASDLKQGTGHLLSSAASNDSQTDSTQHCSSTTCNSQTTSSSSILSRWNHSYPVVEQKYCLNESDPSNGAITLAHSAKRASTLPAFVQLLYTLLQSDWDNLNRIQKRNSSEDVPDRNIDQKTFFPEHLTLTQIYNRIQSNNQYRPPRAPNGRISARNHLFQLLPQDILFYGIAPYLTAKSLYAFRNTCKYVHEALRSRVPGLKLNLYNHQVNTLEWMQRREAPQLIMDDESFRGIHGGSRTIVRSRRASSSIWTIDCRTGTFSSVSKAQASVGRGGLCCDEPGTGKTITILSLILRSMGQSTNCDLPNDSKSLLDEAIFTTYWKQVLSSSIKASALLELIKEIKQTDDFRNKESLIRLAAIRSLSQKGIFDQDFDSFCTLINESISCSMNVPVATSSCVAEKISLFKASLLKRSAKRQNHDISLLLDRRLRYEKFSQLIPSKATLIIVPIALLSHWVNQIQMHIQMSYCCGSKIPIFFTNIKSSVVTGLWHQSQNQREVEHLTAIGTHIPFLFIDEDPTVPLPNEIFLARFMIVVSSTQRLSKEKKNGTLLIENENDDIQIDSSNNLSIDSICPFLKILFLRLVLDEGHTAGNSSTNASEMCYCISAERRWIVTGTPTPQSVSNDGLKNVLGLLKFINYDYFSQRKSSGVSNWKTITKSFRQGSLSAFFQLEIVLQSFMSRKMKRDVLLLNKPEFSNVMIQMSPHEVCGYNNLVSAVQGNILITTMEGKTSGYQDCLLHPLMSSHAQKALTNLRLACFGGANVLPLLKQRDVDRVLSLFRDLHNVGDIKIKMVGDLLRRMNTNQYSSCMQCGMNLHTLLLLPCACFMCTECMTNKTDICPQCKKSFDIDDFQRLQPGINYSWSWNSGDESISSDQFNNAFGRRRKITEHTCRYSPLFSDGKCLDCREIHSCNFLREAVCSICRNVSTPCPQEETKASYVIDSILKSVFSASNRPLKMIIFSQFRQLLNIIGDRLIRRFGSCCIAEFWGSSKHLELQRFSSVNDCICLLLGKDGAHGLDLSFVNRIIFLDQIMDDSVRNQVISRAFRIGAHSSVVVEQLIARDSVEELIFKNNAYTMNENQSSDNQKMIEARAASQVRHLLKNVKLIRSTMPVLRKTSTTSETTKSVHFVDGSPQYS